MIRFPEGTFLRHAGGKSLLWRLSTGACVVVDGAEVFLRYIGREARGEAEIVADIAAEFGLTPEEVMEDFREFVAPLVAAGLCGTDVTGGFRAEEPEQDSAYVSPVAESFDADGNVHDDSWTPLGDFYQRHGLP